MTHPTSTSYHRTTPSEIASLRAAYEASCKERGIDYGTCFCRCGNKTRTAPQTDRAFGYTKGVPVRFIRGHKLSGVAGAYTTCSSCGGEKKNFYGSVCRKCWRIETGKERVIDENVYVIEGELCRRIHLGGEYWVTVDDDDYDWLMQFKWHAAHNTNGDIYARNVEHGRMHRFIMGAVGRWNLVDHKKKPTTDNRRCNLRNTDVFGNNQNRVLSNRNTSGLKGASLLPNGKYKSQIQYCGIKYSLGEHDTPEQAHEAYKAKALELHGEFANFGYEELREEDRVGQTLRTTAD